MARSSRAKRGRDSFHIANRRLPLSYSNLTINPTLRFYEDRRTFHPEGRFRPARSFNKTRHRLVMSDYRKTRKNIKRNNFIKSYGPPISVGFREPERVLICVRRKRRREVMFALNKTGKGKGRQKRPRYSEYSKISCRR